MQRRASRKRWSRSASYASSSITCLYSIERLRDSTDGARAGDSLGFARVVVAWLSNRLCAPLFIAAGVVACTAEPESGLTQTATTVTTTGPDDTDATVTMTTSMTTTGPEDTSTTDTPSDTTSDTSCAGEIVDAPEAPDGWLGPVIAYGFEGNVGEGPDCGGGVTATRLSLVNADTTTCACGCDAGPEDLCAISMFGDCDGAMQIDTYSGDCQPLGAEPVLQFQATSIPLGSCVSSPVPAIAPLTPSLWGCEIPEDGCSEAPDINRICIYAQGTASQCPEGFENGPIGSQQILCEGACDNCMTPEYCMTQLQLELHDSADCSGIPTQTVSPLECPGGQFSAVRAVDNQLTCLPAVELTRTPQTVSVCCVP
jgi:hypothetical protein